MATLSDNDRKIRLVMDTIQVCRISLRTIEWGFTVGLG